MTDQMAQVVSSAAAGLHVAAQLNMDLIMEDTARAVAGRTGQCPAASSR
nr:hypothetical protein GCM10020092_088390 [Actinoplanes digitatis]